MFLSYVRGWMLETGISISIGWRVDIHVLYLLQWKPKSNRHRIYRLWKEVLIWYQLHEERQSQFSYISNEFVKVKAEKSLQWIRQLIYYVRAFPLAK